MDHRYEQASWCWYIFCEFVWYCRLTFSLVKFPGFSYLLTLIVKWLISLLRTLDSDSIFHFLAAVQQLKSMHVFIILFWLLNALDITLLVTKSKQTVHLFSWRFFTFKIPLRTLQLKQPLFFFRVFHISCPVNCENCENNSYILQM